MYSKATSGYSNSLIITNSFRLYNLTLLNFPKSKFTITQISDLYQTRPVPRSLKNLLNYVSAVILFRKLTTNRALLQGINPVHQYILFLNFKRLRFFPSLRTLQNEIFTSLSLGLLAKYFNKGKFFIKSKIVYLVTALFLRKILLFANFKKLNLVINRKPKYFHEILNTLSESSISTYKNPFDSSWVNESASPRAFVFPYILFTNNKSYGATKVKQKGRLKRKISKKIVAINKILD
jgi:hypothetical protein